MKLNYIADLIHGKGQIAIGTIGPVECAAVASDEARSLAMHVRKPGETLPALLKQLDEAIRAALEDDEFIDKINR